MNAVSYAGLPWKIQTSEIVEKIPGDVVDHLGKLMRVWQGAFAAESTWVHDNFKTPSLFAAIDFVVTSDGVGVYEIDDRPCGLGIATLVSPEFAAYAHTMRTKKWPEHISWIANPGRVTDDHVFFGSPLTLRQARVHRTSFLLARNTPREESDFRDIRGCSVSTVSREGDKAYGVDMGMWTTVGIVSDENDRDLYHAELYLNPYPTGPCVFKPLVGTYSRHVRVYYPKGEGRAGLVGQRGDIESEARIIQLVRAQPHQRMVCQPFIRPMQRDHIPKRNMIYRVYFGFSLNDMEWEPLGGFWMASHRLIVQGSPSTVFGPLEMGD